MLLLISCDGNIEQLHDKKILICKKNSRPKLNVCNIEP